MAVKQVIGGAAVGWYFLLTSRCTDKRFFGWMSLRVWEAVRLKLKGWLSSSHVSNTCPHIFSYQQSQSKTFKCKLVSMHIFSQHFFLLMSEQKVILLSSYIFMKPLIRDKKSHSDWQKHFLLFLWIYSWLSKKSKLNTAYSTQLIFFLW